MDIEIFPAEKSCEQGCLTCPLARKSAEITENRINKEVQETFSLIENLLKKNNIKYNLHFDASFNLFPVLSYPELIHMGRFETKKGFTPFMFSQDLKALLDAYAIKPRIIGFSLVPQSPIISFREAEMIKEVIEQLKHWYFFSRYKGIEVTVRSNLIRAPLFQEVVPQLFIADNALLKKIVRDYTSSYSYKRRPMIYEVPGGKVYYNRYVGTVNSRELSISNRVISGIKIPKEKIETINCDQAKFLCPSSGMSADFAIAPKGIMLMHASVAINNPILWMSHDDFREQLSRQAVKRTFSPFRFIQNLIIQNATMYQWVLRNKKDGVIITNDDWLSIFQQLREKLKQ